MRLEPVGISPRIDCVFKTLLGSNEHKTLLLDFLNAVLQPKVPIAEAVIENPISLPDFVGDDFTIVDVRATDQEGSIYQIEMQNYNETALKARILYGWANLYRGQIKQDETPYSDLKAVVSIWVLNRNILRNSPNPHHRFQAADLKSQVVLSPHFEIHTIELDKWRKSPKTVPTMLHRWLEFLSGAENWAEVPVPLKDPVMEEAMGVLQTFQQNQNWNDTYRCRLDGLRRHKTQVVALEEAKAATEQAKAETERERAEKKLAKAQTERERVEKEQAQADAERERVEKEQAQADAERERAEKEQAQADAERERAEKEQAQANAERERAEKERTQAELDQLRNLLARTRQ